MGVRSFVAGTQAETMNSIYSSVKQAAGIAANKIQEKRALDEAKDKTDINREYKGAQSSLDQFMNDLQYDRDYQNYHQRVEEKFDDITATIQDNQLLSDGAKQELMENWIPQLKQETMGKASILGMNAQMAEIEVEIEGFGDTIASDPERSLEESVSQYRAHIEDLGIYNDVTVGKMVEEYTYSSAPLKALQTLQGEYRQQHLDQGYSFGTRIDQIAGEYGLDATQARALRKSAAEFQTNFDAQIDSQFSEQKEILLGEVAKAWDEGQLFDIDSIDAMLPQVPARHRLELYKVKNTAVANNDGLLVAAVQKVVDSGTVLSDDQWKMMDLIHDPKKRDEVAESILVNEGNTLLASGKPLSEVRAAIDHHEGPVSLKNRTEAKARLTKAYLDQQSDVSKVASDMLSSTGFSDPAASRIPQEEYEQVVEEVVQEAPPIDTQALEERGEQYIWEQERLVADFLAKSPSFRLPGPSFTFNSGAASSRSVEDEAVRGSAFNKGNTDYSSKSSERLDNPAFRFDFDSIGTQEASEEQGERISSEHAESLVQEVAKDVVSRQIEGLFSQEAVERIGSESTNNAEPNIEEEPAWVAGYQEKVAQRREEVAQERIAYQEKLAKQAEEVRKTAGVEENRTEGTTRTILDGTMSQVELVTQALQIIKDGEGRYITSNELGLIRDDANRAELTTLAGIRDSFVVDSPLALDFIDQLRRDPTVSDTHLRTVIRDFVERGFVKAETADELTGKYSFAENDNRKVLDTSISEAVSAVYPAGTGQYFGTQRTYLKQRVAEAVDEAIAMNPELLGKDFPLLQKQIQSFVAGEASRKILGDLEAVGKLMSQDDVLRRIDNLERSKVSTFLEDVEEGRYDLLIDYDFVQKPEMRASRHDDMPILLDKITKGMTPYKDFKDLAENGTLFERFRVIANANFIQVGGALEQSLTGSFGIKPKDMKIAGKQWAFADPEADGVYFIATDTDVENRGTLGWGMATGDYDGTKGFIMFRDYVDPKLSYELAELEAQMHDPLFERKKVAADQNRNQLPLGTAGLGYSPVKVQQSLDDRYYGVIEEYETKKKELEQLTNDIMTYRFNLLGMTAGSMPKRL